MSQGELLAGLGAASLSASIIILAVLPLRVLFQNRTPRRVFCLLWDAALARLLVLTALPSPVSVWRWFPAVSSASLSGTSHTAVPRTATPVTEIVVEGTANLSDSIAALPGQVLERNAVLAAVWLAVGLAMAVWFFWSHLRSRRLYADSLHCGNAFVRDWLAAHRLRRRIQVRTSDRIAAPLTYGVLRPVVLLPSGMDWTDGAALSCILEHEYQHIRRFDTLRKAFLVATLCLHWFNPLVWVLYVLSNRDMELACDEAVTAQGVDRAEYAQTLLSMEEQRGCWGLSGSHFSQNALEERIRAIMKHKRISITALIAVMAVMSITVVAFASAAPNSETEPQSGQDAPKAGYVYDHFQAVENDVMILSQGGEDGEKQYSADGGKTWMSEERYHAEYGSWGDDWQVEWWTAGDYAVWLEEEKQALQSIIGEWGYTGGEGWFTWDQKRVDETIALYESILEDIKNGALYSKTITDKNGNVVEDVALGSSGPISGFTTTACNEGVVTASESLNRGALLEELKSFGIGGSEDEGLIYKGQLIRSLVDGVPVGDSGYSIQYLYTNAEGMVDVHTLRSVIHNPDGSYDPMGELTGVAVEGDSNFDWSLIESAAFSDGMAQTEAGSTEDGVEERLEQYKPFGLTYDYNEQRLRMNWNGKPVHSLYDTETGTWYANNMNGYDLPANAVDLETVYRDGILCGLQESQPPHEVIHGAATTAALDGSTEDGVEERLNQYKPFGLTYDDNEQRLRMNWNGKPVHSLYDTETGTWYANNMNGYDLPADAVDLETVYRDGILCGLQESQPPHEVIHEAATTAALDGSTESGRTFEEIFARYQPYGLSYSPRESGMGSLTWNGQAVKSFADLQPDGGVFSYEDPFRENGLRVYTEYDENGNLTGLHAE